MNTELSNICNHKSCDVLIEDSEEYCEDHYAYYYCECGQHLGEYEGEGFCPRCR